MLGSLIENKFEERALLKLSGLLPSTKNWNRYDAGNFLNIIESCVEYFINISNTNNIEHLRHLSHALLQAVPNMFPPPNLAGHEGGDPISEKKLDKGDGIWELRKEVLGLIFYGMTKCMEYPPDKKEKVLAEICTHLRSKNGVRFNKFKKMIQHFRHASIGIPAGKRLFTPFNIILRLKPTRVFYHKNAALRKAVSYWRQPIITVSE